MSTFKRIAGIVSSIVLAVFILNSCVSENDGELPFIPLGTEDNEITTEERTILEYRIVAPRSASAELSDAAEGLREALAEQTGATVCLIYDNEYTERKDGEWDVYVGCVELVEASTRLGSLRSEDYTCRSYDGFTVIGGRRDDGTLAAIERFCEEILPISDEYGLIPDGGGFDYAGVYETEALNIGDASISAFEIAYSASDDGALAVAVELRQRISDSFGYWLELRADSTSDTGRGIYLDVDSDCEDSRAELSFSGKDVTLRAPESVGLKIAADRLFELLIADGRSGILSPTLPARFYVPYGDTECDIASLALYKLLPFDAPAEITYVTSALGEYSPDAFLCGEMDDTDSSTLSLFIETYGTLQTSIGTAFALPDTSVTELCATRKSGLLVEVLQIKRGELEFIFVYVSGTAENDTVLDISELVGDTPHPVVAVAHTYNGGDVTLIHSGEPYFERVILDETLYYEDSFTYVCYADASRLSVVESGEADRCGYRQITVSVD